MATARHVRCVLIGERTNTAFPEEGWQTGISVVQSDQGGDFPGGIRVTLPSFSADIVGESTVEGDWSVDWAWQGSSIFTKQNQVAMVGALSTFYDAIKGKIPTDSRLVGIRISAFDAQGKVIGGANQFTLATPHPGSGTVGTQTPPQIAVVASLRTGRRGPSGRGRMYLPLNSATPSSGVMGSADRTLVATSVSQLCSNLWALGHVPAVVNPKALTYSGITSVECGNMFDTQRRRRNQALESRTTVAVTY